MRHFLIAFTGLSLLATPVTVVQARESKSEKGDKKTSVAHEIRRQAKGKIDEFYTQRGFWPIWVTGDHFNAAVPRYLELLSTANIDGLDGSKYGLAELREAVRKTNAGSPKDLARTELLLSKSFARYVQDMRKPTMDMLYLDPEVEPQVQSEDVILRRAALAGPLPEYLANMGWMHPIYAGLRESLFRSDEPQELVPLAKVPEGPLLKKGAKGERVGLLRSRLGLVPGEQFDDDLLKAVKEFQSANGLGADGVVGAKTIAALNVEPEPPAPLDVEAVKLNLQRARLLPDASVRHVVVNAAAATLAYYDEGVEQGRMKVVVGAAESQTPMMAGMVRYATLNPYWNIPIDLVQKRIAPKILAGSNLKKLGYEVMSDWTAEAEVVDAKTVDWKAVADGDVQLRVRELPGNGNAMGTVKFMFPNNQGIYLHDTPNRALFKESARQFSNGCVRLEDADRLGEWFFGEKLVTDIHDPEQHRPLPRAVPVYLTYLTAVPDKGRVAYFKDVYSRDKAPAALLAGK